MIILGTNSFIDESEFYSHLATRLNADEFSYLAAAYEAGAQDAEVAQIFSDMRGATLAALETALADFLIDVTPIYNALNGGNTTVQTKNRQALILATELIDQFDFIGNPTAPTQPLKWPRVGAIDRNRQPIPADTIPASIKKATAELALILLQHDLTNPRQQQHLYLLTSEMVGQTQASFAKNPNRRLTTYVMDLLKPLLLDKSAFSSALLF